MNKKWYTSKTLWVNVFTVLVGVVGYVAGHDVIQSHTAFVAGLVAVQGALNVALRFVTWQPIK